MRGSGLGCRTPLAWGAQHWGPLPLPVLPPCPHPTLSIPMLGGRGGNTAPLQTHPIAPEHPLLPSALGPSGWEMPSATPQCQHPPLHPQTHHRPGWGGTGNQILLVKLGPPVKAPLPSTAWGEDPGFLTPQQEPPPHLLPASPQWEWGGWAGVTQGRDGTGAIGMCWWCLTWGTATRRVPCAPGTCPVPHV